MHRQTLALFFVVTLATSAAFAEAPAPGKIYRGPKNFNIPTLGLSFVLPKGYVGGLDGEFFTVMDPRDQGQTGMVLMWSKLGKLEEARQLMSQRIPIAGVVLQPKAPPVVRKKVITATYSIVGGGALMEASITTRVDQGTIVAIIAAYAPEKKALLAKLGQRLFRSLKLKKPRVASAKGSTSGSGEWHQWLNGARLTRFSTGSGYSEKESYTFCSDGSFARNFGASSVSGLGTGAASANNSGRWSVSGKGNDGLIVLQFADGSVDRTPVQYRDGKTFWGGTRYFYEPNICR